MKESLSYQSYKKSPFHSTKHTTYFETYDALLSPYRDKEIVFVEIGILEGGSLFMWRDFFGPKARIIGVDLNPNAKKWEAHGFEIFIGSQSDEAFWEAFVKEVGPVDVVLDDGGHTYEQQIVTTEYLIENIKEGGMLVVEDTHTSYMDGFGPKKYSFMEYTKKLADAINMRFGSFQQSAPDRRIWSIEIFESIVAFKVNRKASNLRSEFTENGGAHDHARDYRYHENAAVGGFDRAKGKLGFLKAVPGMRQIAQTIRIMLANRNSKARHYFR